MERACRTRARLLVLGLLAVLAGSALTGCGLGGSAPPSPPPPTSPYAPYAARAEKALTTMFKSLAVHIPRTAGEPAPSLPPMAFRRGLGSKVVLGFLPSWELGDVGAVDYGELSEVAYYGLQVRPSGTILESGMGWDSLADGDVDELVADAHEAGARALLTLYDDSTGSLANLAAGGSTTGTRLADAAAQLLADHDFDGVDLDLEGTTASSRAGFVRFVTAFSSRLRALDGAAIVVLNTFPQSAVDSDGFFDVAALAPYVNDFFVMAYDMSDGEIPAPTAPLEGPELSDVSSLASYVATVPAGKVILGIPFFGYDYTASRPTLPAVTIGSPVALGYDAIVGGGGSPTWDPTTETAEISSKVGGKWHQIFFDDPVSVALKVALAAAFGTAGVGAWELGLAVQHPAMARALDGGSPPRRLSEG